MGGMGSGRYASYGGLVDTCEDYKQIDIAWLRRETSLTLGDTGRLTWSRNGQETGSISYRIETGGLRLIYRTRRAGGPWRDVADFIPFTYTTTNFGGERQWYCCPSCHNRCRILYGGSLFRCRRCHDLKYESQYENAIERTSSQRHKLRKRLGQVGSLDDPFPDKPKGMHWATYERLKARDNHLEMRWCTDVAGWLKRNQPKFK